MNKRVISILSVVALVLCLALSMTACSVGKKTRVKATASSFKLTSFTVTRSGSLNEDKTHTMCLSLEDGACESVALTYQFDNPQGYPIISIVVNGKTFDSTDFRVGSSALKVVIDYIPEATSGEYTIKTDKIVYKQGTTSKLVTAPSNGSVNVLISPEFTITFNASESAATDIDEITFSDTVKFGDTMRNMEKFYDETEMDSTEAYSYGKAGYGFSGWYTEPNGQGTEIKADTVYDYYTDMTLYAHYEMFFTYKTVTSEDESFDESIAGEDNAYVIITGTTTTGNKRSILTVTEEYDGVKVKELGSRALINVSAGSIILNESLVKIGISACQGLGGSILMQNNVVEICESAFAGCTGLGKQTSFTIPSGVKIIGNNAFSGCTWNYNSSNKNTLIIPATVESIGTKAFYNSGFEKICFEQGSSFSDKTFGDSVFANSLSLSTLRTSITIDDNKKIVVQADNGLNYIGSNAFKGAASLKFDEYTLAEGLKTIAANAFSADTKKIETLIIPNTLEYIGSDAFTNSGLKEIIFKNGIKSGNPGDDSHLYTIGDYAFSSCAFGNTAGTDQVDLTAPYLSTYGIAPFFGNTNLKVIKIKSDSVPQYMGQETSYRDGGTYTKYYVPKEQLSLYKKSWRINITGWISAFDYSATLPICPREDIITSESNRQYALTIDEANMTAVLETIFAPNTGAESVVTIPGTLTSGTKTYTITAIGSYVAHANVAALSFEAPQNIVEIQDYAFAGCKYLTTVNFKAMTSLESIGERAFYKTSVTSFESGSDALTTIGQDAFYLCKSLSVVKIAHGTDVQLREYAFCYSGVKDVILGANVKYIESGAFAYCDSLANVYYGGADNIHHKNTMLIGPFRSSAAGDTDGVDAESGASNLKIYVINSTVKGYISADYYYTLKTTGEIVHPTVPNTKTLHEEWRNFYAAYKNCINVNSELVNGKLAD